MATTPLKMQKRLQQDGCKITRLALMRVKRGISQRQLGAMTGLGLSSIRGYEHERRNVDNATLSSLIKICLALDCGIVDILEDKRCIEDFKKVGVIHRE